MVLFVLLSQVATKIVDVEYKVSPQMSAPT